MSAYRDYEQLSHLLDLYSRFFNCYVHIDKKSAFSDEEHVRKLNQINNVTVISDYRINWGSYCHLLALSKLLKMAYNDESNTRFHLISDTDFPIKSHYDFERFFNDNVKNYIEVTDISNNPFMQKRYQIFHLQHIFDRKSASKLEVYTDKIIRNLQYALKVKRNTSYKYKGLVWGSITRDAAKACLDYLDEKRILDLKYCESAEEFWLNNALMESCLNDTVIANNLRYAVWDENHVNGPRELSIKDLSDINEFDGFFARKVIMGKDDLDMILEDRFLS